MKCESIQDVRQAVEDTTRDVVKDFQGEPDTDRETVIERLDEECDALWGHLVYMGRIDQWDEDTLADHASECSIIIKTARQDAWVETDIGLWEGLTYGVLPSIAYFSLRNLLYQSLANAGHDTNEEMPFAKEKADA